MIITTAFLLYCHHKVMIMTHHQYQICSLSSSQYDFIVACFTHIVLAVKVCKYLLTRSIWHAPHHLQRHSTSAFFVPQMLIIEAKIIPALFNPYLLKIKFVTQRRNVPGVENVVTRQFLGSSNHFLTTDDTDIVRSLQVFRGGIRVPEGTTEKDRSQTFSKQIHQCFQQRRQTEN